MPTFHFHLTKRVAAARSRAEPTVWLGHLASHAANPMQARLNGTSADLALLQIVTDFKHFRAGVA